MRRFILCVDRLDAKAGRIWGVRSGGRWRTAKEVRVQVPVTTVFRGLESRQPKAYLTGSGVLRWQAPGVLSIV